jgi:hypothetical protein
LNQKELSYQVCKYGHFLNNKIKYQTENRYTMS